MKLNLADYGKGEERHLVRAMGFEAANVHLRSQPGRVAAVGKHVGALANGRFREAVEQLATTVASDRHAWKSHFHP